MNCHQLDIRNDTVLSHSSSDDERIMAEWITILDFCVISLILALGTDQLTISRFPDT
jgi:hypothetical protein